MKGNSPLPWMAICRQDETVLVGGLTVVSKNLCETKANRRPVFTNMRGCRFVSIII